MRRSLWVVNGAEHHIRSVEIAWFEVTIYVRDLFLSDAEGNFFIQAGRRADDGYLSVGIESMQNTPRGDLPEEFSIYIRARAVSAKDCSSLT